jgi:hypothetical protein
LVIIAEWDVRVRVPAVRRPPLGRRLNPNASLARWAFGYGLHRAERLQEAVEQFDTALRLSARDPEIVVISHAQSQHPVSAAAIRRDG